MNILKIIKRKKKEREYIHYIDEHKENVIKAAKELYNCPKLIDLFMDDELSFLFWERIHNHDNSKYSKEEFDAYRKYYYPIDDEEKNNSKDEYEKAWIHHYENNDHHWQNRKDKQNFNVNNNDDILPVLENIVDWLAMGYKFNDRPYQFYERNKNEIILNQDERNFLEKIIYEALEDKKVPKLKNESEDVSSDSIAR